jgi:glutamate-1-semialdehyde 2,1-aminomutase
MTESNSERVFRESYRIFPGGVNSPVRSFSSVGGQPFIVKSGRGPWLYDLDGKKYVDYVMSWGPLILGHAYPDVVVAIGEGAKLGTSFGAPTEGELMLASLVCERMPWIGKLRFLSSGTEACMTAIRIARAATGRSKIVKFDGCYHGHSDSFLVKAGSGMATGGLPSSAGVLNAVSENTISLPYNNIDLITKQFTEMGDAIAAVIVEPVAANMGVIPPVDGFLKTLRNLTSHYGGMLIFDEVITGFRVASGGAVELFDIKPDLVCLGKILGGGMPVGAIGGKKELLDLLAPVGKVYQAGTLSGNPISMAAGIATLKALFNPEIYKNIKQYADDLTGRILELAHKYGVALKINKVESLFTLFFSDEEMIDFESAKRSDMKAYSRFFHHMLNAGVFIPPSGYEAWFVSNAHGKEEMEITIDAINGFLEDYDRQT